MTFNRFVFENLKKNRICFLNLNVKFNKWEYKKHPSAETY